MSDIFPGVRVMSVNASVHKTDKVPTVILKIRWSQWAENGGQYGILSKTELMELDNGLDVPGEKKGRIKTDQNVWLEHLSRRLEDKRLGARGQVGSKQSNL